MKLLIALLAIACLTKLSEGYLCYECNSTIDVNCFDFSPTFSYYKAVECDSDGSGMEKCLAVHISERKQRRMYRGCKKTNICEEYERLEASNIFVNLISCSECDSHKCNASDSLHRLLSTTIIAFLSVIFTTLSR